MTVSPSRNIAKLMSLSLLAAGIWLAPSAGAFARPMVSDTPVPMSIVRQAAESSGVASQFVREQAMSAPTLIERWTPFITEASRRFGIAETWIKAVMRMESGGRTMLDQNRLIKSDAGAMGLMQIMPETYNDMRQQHGLGADPYNPRDNVLAGAAYLRWLYEKYGYPKMFAAYNAGPGTLDAQAAGARSLPGETRAYVKGIANILGPKSEPSSTDVLAHLDSPPPFDPMATLTRPDGSSITIEGAEVDSIRISLPNEFAPGVQTVVAMGAKQQGIREDLATAISILRTHGAKI